MGFFEFRKISLFYFDYDPFHFSVSDLKSFFIDPYVTVSFYSVDYLFLYLVLIEF